MLSDRDSLWDLLWFPACTNVDSRGMGAISSKVQSSDLKASQKFTAHFARDDPRKERGAVGWQSELRLQWQICVVIKIVISRLTLHGWMTKLISTSDRWHHTKQDRETSPSQVQVMLGYKQLVGTLLGRSCIGWLASSGMTCCAVGWKNNLQSPGDFSELTQASSEPTS